MGKKNCVSTRLADDYRTLDVKYCTEKFELKKKLMLRLELCTLLLLIFPSGAKFYTEC